MSRFSKRRPGEFRLRFGWHLALWLALAVTVAVGSGAALWWALGSPNLAAGFEARDRFELIKVALAVAAGVGGVVALVVASRKLHLSEAEHGREEDAARREDTKLFNERFGNAADQLSSDKSAARLAGAYAMAGLADDWEEGRQTCIDVLCAYLRMPYTPTVCPEEAEIEDRAAQSAAQEERLVRHSPHPGHHLAPGPRREGFVAGKGLRLHRRRVRRRKLRQRGLLRRRGQLP
jgi:hypothetical protein